MRTLAMLLACFSMLGCHNHHDGAPKKKHHHIKKAKPHAESKSRYGNPSTYVVRGKRYHVLKSNKHFKQRGYASWYGTKFHGRLTSNREVYDLWAMTGAHKTLPLPTYVRVTNLKNHKSAIIRINDRGPFHGHRILDLSYGAAKKLGVLATGTAPVEIQTLDFAPKRLDIQVGAFSSLDRAKKAAKDLRQFTRKTTIHAKYAKNHDLYIVSIHPTKMTPKLREHLKTIYHISEYKKPKSS